MAFFNSVEPHETSTDTSTLNNILFTPCCDLSFSMAQLIELNMAHNINQPNGGEQNLQIAQLDKINLVD